MTTTATTTMRTVVRVKREEVPTTAMVKTVPTRAPSTRTLTRAERRVGEKVGCLNSRRLGGQVDAFVVLAPGLQLSFRLGPEALQILGVARRKPSKKSSRRSANTSAAGAAGVDLTSPAARGGPQKEGGEEEEGGEEGGSSESDLESGVELSGAQASLLEPIAVDPSNGSLGFAAPSLASPPRIHETAGASSPLQTPTQSRRRRVGSPPGHHR
jgi:hypothetical protein